MVRSGKGLCIMIMVAGEGSAESLELGFDSFGNSKNILARVIRFIR
jgi:hypothetical protein